MDFKKLYAERKLVRNNLIAGAIVGVLFATLEYSVKLETDSPEAFIPLVIRSAVTGMLIYGTVIVFELQSKYRFIQKPFLYLVLVRSVFYTFIITLWLIIINSAWYVINGGIPVQQELLEYIQDDMYLINLISVFTFVIIGVGLGQINKLHRRGELINFILGKYHTPREVELIFCFIDLKGSTTIAEKLGHFGFANFLKDYYSDITEALRETNARIYQYVGDEIILSWSYKDGIKNNCAINCFFKMQAIIRNRKQHYIAKYGVYPEFKAGLHGGQVIVTWVGELKKEIVYIGDVLNTTARIEEDCKRLQKDFLISGELLEKMPELDNIKASFIEETIPRGKEERVSLYSLEEIS